MPSTDAKTQKAIRTLRFPPGGGDLQKDIEMVFFLLSLPSKES